MAKEFEIDFKPFKEGVKLELNNLTSTVADEMFRKIVARNPVDTGYSRSRWQVETYQNTKGFVRGEITNDAPYIIYLEMGSSDQAPNGFIQITVAEMEAKYSK